jgi:SpoVK/Ycf46/Vps4 family AAA+-type ATPase
MKIPEWAQEVAEHLQAGESALFILHGQVFDYVRVNGGYLPCRAFLGDWLGQERHVVFYNLGLGLEFGDAQGERAFRQALAPPPAEDDEEDVSRVRARALKALGQRPGPEPLPQSPREVLQLAERVMTACCQFPGATKPLALILEYTETMVPALELGSMPEADRASLVTLLRWSRHRELIQAGHVVILTTGNLADLNPNLLLSRYGAQIIEVPAPDLEARVAFIEHLLAQGQYHLALTPQELANLAAGLSLSVVGALLRQSRRGKPLTMDLVRRRKKELLRQELVGLIEVIEPRYGLADIGGLEPIKEYFAQIAQAIQAGDDKLVPRGITMMGPPGVGKTALAEALARDCGFNFIKLLNPRTKWVGESERNFFKALQTLRTLTPVVVVEDEADQSEHGRDEYSGDTGVSNRLRQMRFEFVGDPAIQGKVLWIRITNRPDRLDKADLRSGRSSERIPFFMPDFTEKVHILEVVARRSQIPCAPGDFPEVVRHLEDRHPEVITGGDLEEIVFRAYRLARTQGREAVNLEDFRAVIDDFLPPHQMEVLRQMERLALNQCSSRRFIPERVWSWAARREEAE